MPTNKLMDLINEAGGYTAFARKMGTAQSLADTVKEAAAGRRVPSKKTRDRIIAAAGGRITEAEIIAISGRSKPDLSKKLKSDAHWESDNPEKRRDWIATKAAEGARATRLANEARAK